MKTDKKLVEDERPMKTIRVDVDATTTLYWEGGEIELTVPEDADEEQIEKELLNYLMSPEANLDWTWNEPEIDGCDVVDDEDDEDRE